MEPTDWPSIARIYQEGINMGNATFQQDIPSWDDWHKAHIASCRIVAIIDRKIIAWAALPTISSRYTYRSIAEVSVYIDSAFRRQKIGSQIGERLVFESGQAGFWTLQVSIFPENNISIKLHESQGFRTEAFKEKIDEMRGIWRNTILLERRSKVTGNSN